MNPAPANSTYIVIQNNVSLTTLAGLVGLQLLLLLMMLPFDFVFLYLSYIIVLKLEGKVENYQVCSVQYCVQQLCTVRCTHI